MERQCKNAFCNATDPSLFTKSNKYLCRSCLKQRRDMAKRSELVGESVASSKLPLDVEVAGPKTFGPGPFGSKTIGEGKSRRSKKTEDVVPKIRKTMEQSSDVIANSTLTHLIATQQKMIEHQQRQTDALFNLTEKLLLSRAPDVGAGGDFVPSKRPGDARTSSPTNSHEFRSKIISHTPRRRQEFVHYKNRLD